MKNRFLVLLSALLIASCASLGTQSYLPVLKENVIPLLNENTPHYCSYKGRGKFRYSDPLNNYSANIILDKTCTDDVYIKVLGFMGNIAADIKYVDGNYSFTSSYISEDVYEPVLSEYEIGLLLKFLTMPPYQVDDEYYMQYLDRKYYFFKGELALIFSDKFIIESIETPYYKIDYKWNKSKWESMKIISGANEILISFTDQWRD